MKKIIVLFSLVTFFISCGGHKKTVTTSKINKVTPTGKITIKREDNIKESAKSTEINVEPPIKLSYQERVQKYIYEFSEIAMNEMKLFGIPASITLAQGILESGAGYGDLTQRANNHFGIKCHDWDGDRVYHDDDQNQECFRKYSIASHSFRDHSTFLTGRKRYGNLFKLKKEDYKQWAKGLKAAGYATDKKYPDKLIRIIEQYQLYEFDKEVLGDDYTKKENSIAQSKPKNFEYIVKKGDTLYSISRKYNIALVKLKAFNNLKDNTISIGQKLIVEAD